MGSSCVTMGNKSGKSASLDISQPSSTGGGKAEPKPGDSSSTERSAPANQQKEEPIKEKRLDLCSVDDLQDGQIKEVEVEGKKLLVAREKGEYYAVSSKCTHFGASLINGAYCNGRIRCPWHGACFNVTNGDIEDFPGLDSLQSFDVNIRDGKVTIHTNTKQLSTTKRVKKMMHRDLECTLLYLIVGGGPAALECAESLRQNNYKGKILIITMEKDPPYDRTKLSKSLTSTAADLSLRPADFYKQHKIDLEYGLEAFQIDTEMSHCVFKGGKYTDYTVEYDQLMIATGSSPTLLKKPGAMKFPNQMLYMRDPHDSNKVAEKCKDRNAVVVGTSFIGMEVAAYLVDKAKSVTVVGRSGFPFIRSLGEKVGEIIKRLFEDKGVKFELNTEVQELIGEGSRLQEIKLTNGTTLPADCCVVGLGTKPNTDWLKESGVELTAAGHIKVNKYMKTTVDNVYAAGDCTSFPLYLNDGSVNIGHYQMALAQGHNAGLNMCLQEEPFKSVPYFWTMVFGKSIRFCGYNNGYDDAIFHGDNSKFVCFYLRGKNVVGVSSLASDPVVSIAAEIMYAGVTIKSSDIRESPDNLKNLLPK